MKPSRPVLRYHGGKWRLAPWIISHFPTHRVYVEPFGGAASVLLRKPRSYAEVYNDLDGEVVNVFRTLRDPSSAGRLREALALTPFSREEFELSYKPTTDSGEQARRTIVRSFMGFGSDSATGAQTGFRSNSNRSGTTPARDWFNYPAAVETFAERLRGVVVDRRDASEVMLQHDTPDALHYVDPPYVGTTRSKTTQRIGKGYRHEMTDADHKKLAVVLHSLSGAVVISGYDSELYGELYRGWTRVTKETHADGALPRIETLWLNPKADTSQNFLNLGGAA